MGRPKKPIEWEVNGDGCHICISHSRSTKGYPILHYKGKSRSMSHFIYTENYGDIPFGMQVLHHCDNPSCINPEHLFVGTNADNVADKVSKNRQSRLIGEHHPMAKLTENDVRDIRNMVGLKCRDIAKIYNIDHSTVAYIRKGKLWKHLADEVQI